MSIYEALQLMLAFSTFVVVLLTLVVAIIVLAIKKGCIINTGHGKKSMPRIKFYIQKDKYPIQYKVKKNK